MHNGQYCQHGKIGNLGYCLRLKLILCGSVNLSNPNYLMPCVTY
jgi:hypothetical protein